MPSTPQNTLPTDAPRRRTVLRAHAKPLSVIHAAALYRPVPPVGFDDDGYPHTDEAPVDNSNHNVATNYLRSALAERYSTRSDATVHAALGLFFKEGNRGALVVPDVFVAFGVDAGHRWSYKLWEEPKPPAVVVEVLSEQSCRKDLRVKPSLYEALGIGEYWSFDQHRVGDGQPLVLRRLVNGRYRVDESESMAGHSEAVGLDLRVEGDRLILHDPKTGLDLPDYNEAVGMYRQARDQATQAQEQVVHAQEQAVQAQEQAAQAEARATADAEARRAAEQRIAELEELLRSRDV